MYLKKNYDVFKRRNNSILVLGVPKKGFHRHGQSIPSGFQVEPRE